MKQQVVRALTDLEHVRRKPDMYIGACQPETLQKWTLDGEKIVFKEVTFVPALLKMFDEIISNSIDEAIRTNFEHANKINIQLKSDHVIVRDNGRGIPVAPSLDFPKLTQAEVALTQLRSGANFSDDDTVSIGTHGLGASLVNILSTKFLAGSDDGKKSIDIKCQDNLKSHTAVVGSSKRGNQGVYIEYWPDFNFFGCDDMSGDLMGLLEKRVTDLAANFPLIQFMLNGSKVKSVKFRDYVKMIGEGGDFVETDEFKVAIIPSEEYNQISFVNGIDTYEGGIHVDYVRDKVGKYLLEELDRKFKKLKLERRDIKNKMTFVVMSSKIVRPKFRSQTKEYVSAAKSTMVEIFGGLFEDGSFIRKLARNEAIVQPIIETKQFRLDLEANKDAKDKQKALGRIKVPKHIPANGSPEKTTLFITEGDSASGPFTKARNPDFHGSFPLRGKPMNTHGTHQRDILENKELQQLMAILGLRFGDGPATKMAYGHISIMADADYDGYSIVCLLLAFFNHWPWLFDQKRISVVRCPIIKMVKGKEVKRFYTLADYEGQDREGWTISYMKGLGSLSPEEYEMMVNTPVREIVTNDGKAQAALEIAFGDSADARKEWLSKGNV